MNFLTDGFLQIIQRTGVFERKHAISNTPLPPKKLHVERSGERWGHDKSPKREMRCPVNMIRTMVIDSFVVCAVSPSCLNHTLAQPHHPPPRLNYWVLPIQKKSGSHGSEVLSIKTWWRQDYSNQFFIINVLIQHPCGQLRNWIA